MSCPAVTFFALAFELSTFRQQYVRLTHSDLIHPRSKILPMCSTTLMYESLEINGTLHHVENNGCTTTSYYNAKVNLLKSYTQCADILTTIKREIIPFLLRHLEPYQLLCDRGQMQKIPFKAHELA